MNGADFFSLQKLVAVADADDSMVVDDAGNSMVDHTPVDTDGLTWNDVLYRASIMQGEIVDIDVHFQGPVFISSRSFQKTDKRNLFAVIVNTIECASFLHSYPHYDQF